MIRFSSIVSHLWVFFPFNNIIHMHLHYLEYIINYVLFTFIHFVHTHTFDIPANHIQRQFELLKNGMENYEWNAGNVLNF